MNDDLILEALTAIKPYVDGMELLFDVSATHYITKDDVISAFCRIFDTNVDHKDTFTETAGTIISYNTTNKSIEKKHNITISEYINCYLKDVEFITNEKINLFFINTL